MTECNAALSRFERAGHRAKLQTEMRRQEERNELKDEELIRCTVRAFDNDHTYAWPLTEDTPREQLSQHQWSGHKRSGSTYVGA